MTRLLTLISGISIILLAQFSFAADDGVNPDYVYFTHGDTPENWNWVLADEDNWWMPLESNSGVSAGGKVQIKPIDFKGKGDAVELTWDKKEKTGTIAIHGRTVNLSHLEHSTELVLITKINQRPKGDVTFQLECGEKCSGAIPMKGMLRTSPQKEWFVLPIPLDCFTHAGAKLDAVSVPLKIDSRSRFSISIASIYLQPMAKGDEGCTPNPKPGAEAPAAEPAK